MEDVTHRFSIEVEFLSYSENGVLFYADGVDGDVVAVVLVDG